MRTRPLVVIGRQSATTAAMCRVILDAAGLGGAKRKIVGDAAPPPPVVIETDTSHSFTPDDVVVVTEGGSVPSATVRLVVCDARVANAAGSLYGLDDPETPGWMGALVPPDEKGVQPFDLYAGGSYGGRFAIGTAGEDAVRCALGAIAACGEGFAVHLETARRALALYRP